MTYRDGQGHIPLAWSVAPEDNERIGVMRLRLLQGRTAEEVEALHLVVLERTVPPRGRHMMRLRDRRYLDALLAEMERHVMQVESADLVGYSSLGGEHRLLEVA
jgi:hypothetical protein